MKDTIHKTRLAHAQRAKLQQCYLVNYNQDHAMGQVCLLAGDASAPRAAAFFPLNTRRSRPRFLPAVAAGDAGPLFCGTTCG